MTENGLDPRAFEQIVQAIAKKEIANGVTPFGDGPDGGREATFSGKMNYPSATAPWDGYLVIQSKFKLHPTGNPKDDGDWLIEQLSKDLAKFSDIKRSLKRPEYYLATTNIRLSAVAGFKKCVKRFGVRRLYATVSAAAALWMCLSVNAGSANMLHRAAGILQPFTYADVTLTGGPVAAQEQFSREFFLAIPNDDILNGFRLRAGLPAPGKAMGGWYDPDNFAGGCTLGQWISALSRDYANTGDARFKEKVTQLVHGFHETIAPDGFFFISKKFPPTGRVTPTTKTASECATPTRSLETRKHWRC